MTDVYRLRAHPPRPVPYTPSLMPEPRCVVCGHPARLRPYLCSYRCALALKGEHDVSPL